MKIVIKVGTQAILSEQGEVHQGTLHQVVNQLAALSSQGHQVVLVSSGAVGKGRHVARDLLGREYGHSIGEKQVLASIGQPELMHSYYNLFKKHDMLPAQLLLTKQDFHTRQHYLNIARLLREILSNQKVIPIINENDSVGIEELMFTDNDELAGLIATQINADKLIILSSIEGVFDKHPEEEGANLIPVINPGDKWQKVSADKTTHGRGGMMSKLTTVRKLSALGIMSHIAHIQEKEVILRLAQGESVGTTILPFKKKSNKKRWIGIHAHQHMGRIEINQGLFAILIEQSRAVSILPVGIETCAGEFRKGDVIEIVSPQGDTIGVGVARYDSEKLSSLLGQQHQPVFIHYDHLYIEHFDRP